MKIKYIIFTLILLILFSFIFYSNKKIEGEWTKVYSYSEEGDFSTYFSNSSFLKIENGKFLIYDYGYIENPKEEKYFIIGNKFYFYRYDFIAREKIEILNIDSLVIRHSDNIKSVYKRVTDTLKNTANSKIKLIDKMFKFKSKEFMDTVFFDQEYFIYKNKENQRFGWDTAGWELKNINGFEVMLTGYDVAFIIKKRNDKTFLYRPKMGKEMLEIELGEIKENLNEVKRVLERIKDKDQKGK